MNQNENNLSQSGGTQEDRDAATATATTTNGNIEIKSPAKAKTAFMCFVTEMNSQGKNDDEVSIHALTFKLVNVILSRRVEPHPLYQRYY